MLMISHTLQFAQCRLRKSTCFWGLWNAAGHHFPDDLDFQGLAQAYGLAQHCQQFLHSWFFFVFLSPSTGFGILQFDTILFECLK